MSSVSKTPQTRLQGRKMAGRSMSQTDETPRNFALMIVGISVLVISVVTFGFFKFHKSIVHLPKMNTMNDRLIYTIQLQAFSLVPLLICVLHVIFMRITNGAINPLSGNEAVVEKSQRILTNTLEQSFLNLFSLIILATYIHPEYMFLMVYLVSMFVFGRILFIIGYNIHPKFRGVGFSMGMTSTVFSIMLTLAYATGINRMIHSGLTSGSRSDL